MSKGGACPLLGARKRLPYLRGLEGVNRGDMWMIQRSEDLGLALETGQALSVLDEVGRQRFDRDVAVELGVAGAIDLAHAALAQPVGDLVVE